jgi:hypothetical protein
MTSSTRGWLGKRAGAADDHDRLVWQRWVRAMMLGELVGFVPPAVAGAVAYRAGAPDWAMLPILAVAGSLEGAALGYAQSTVLDDELPSVSRRGWVVATAGAATGAWAIGMLPSALGSFTEEHPVAVGAVMVVLAPALLMSIGFAQWLVLRRTEPESGSWVPANAIAWLAGLPAVFVTMAVVPNGAPIAVRAVAGVAGAVVMGAVAASITGVALLRLVRRSHKREGALR